MNSTQVSIAKVERHLDGIEYHLRHMRRTPAENIGVPARRTFGVNATPMRPNSAVGCGVAYDVPKQRTVHFANPRTTSSNSRAAPHPQTGEKTNRVKWPTAVPRPKAQARHTQARIDTSDSLLSNSSSMETLDSSSSSSSSSSSVSAARLARSPVRRKDWLSTINSTSISSMSVASLVSFSSLEGSPAGELATRWVQWRKLAYHLLASHYEKCNEVLLRSMKARRAVVRSRLLSRRGNAIEAESVTFRDSSHEYDHQIHDTSGICDHMSLSTLTDSSASLDELSVSQWLPARKRHQNNWKTKHDIVAQRKTSSQQHEPRDARQAKSSIKEEEEKRMETHEPSALCTNSDSKKVAPRQKSFSSPENRVNTSRLPELDAPKSKTDKPSLQEKRAMDELRQTIKKERIRIQRAEERARCALLLRAQVCEEAAARTILETDEDTSYTDLLDKGNADAIFAVECELKRLEEYHKLNTQVNPPMLLVNEVKPTLLSLNDANQLQRLCDMAEIDPNTYEQMHTRPKRKSLDNVLQQLHNVEEQISHTVEEATGLSNRNKRLRKTPSCTMVICEEAIADLGNNMAHERTRLGEEERRARCALLLRALLGEEAAARAAMERDEEERCARIGDAAANSSKVVKARIVRRAADALRAAQLAEEDSRVDIEEDEAMRAAAVLEAFRRSARDAAARARRRMEVEKSEMAALGNNMAHERTRLGEEERRARCALLLRALLGEEAAARAAVEREVNKLFLDFEDCHFLGDRFSCDSSSRRRRRSMRDLKVLGCAAEVPPLSPTALNVSLSCDEGVSLTGKAVEIPGRCVKSCATRIVDFVSSESKERTGESASPSCPRGTSESDKWRLLYLLSEATQTNTSPSSAAAVQTMPVDFDDEMKDEHGEEKVGRNIATQFSSLTHAAVQANDGFNQKKSQCTESRSASTQDASHGSPRRVSCGSGAVGGSTFGARTSVKESYQDSGCVKSREASVSPAALSLVSSRVTIIKEDAEEEEESHTSLQPRAEVRPSQRTRRRGCASSLRSDGSQEDQQDESSSLLQQGEQRPHRRQYQDESSTDCTARPTHRTPPQPLELDTFSFDLDYSSDGIAPTGMATLELLHLERRHRRHIARQEEVQRNELRWEELNNYRSHMQYTPTTTPTTAAGKEATGETSAVLHRATMNDRDMEEVERDSTKSQLGIGGRPTYTDLHLPEDVAGEERGVPQHTDAKWPWEADRDGEDKENILPLPNPPHPMAPVTRRPPVSWCVEMTNGPFRTPPHLRNRPWAPMLTRSGHTPSDSARRQQRVGGGVGKWEETGKLLYKPRRGTAAVHAPGKWLMTTTNLSKGIATRTVSYPAPATPRWGSYARNYARMLTQQQPQQVGMPAATLLYPPYSRATTSFLESADWRFQKMYIDQLYSSPRKKCFDGENGRKCTDTVCKEMYRVSPSYCNS